MIPILGWIIYLIIRPPETIDEIYWGDLERRYLKYEAKDLGDCPKCGAQLYPGYVYCPDCGERIKRKCSKCEVYIDLEYKYCPHCGNQMSKKSQKEEEISQEEMQKQIEETKEEAHETVKSKKSKYKQEQDFVHRVGESIIKGYKLLGKKTKKFFTKIFKKKNKSKKAKSNKESQKKIKKGKAFTGKKNEKNKNKK
jgi:hypothetical protein